MSEQQITEAVRDVLAQHGKLAKDIDEVGDDDDLYALGLSSHATVNVVMALEDALDIEIPDELLVKKTFTSVTSLTSAIEGVAA